MLTSFAALPYVLAVNGQPPEQVPLPMAVIVMIQSLQLFIVLFLGGWLALRLGEQIGLDSPFARAFVDGRPVPKVSARRLALAAAVGIGVGLTLLALDRYIFSPVMPQAKVDLTQGVAVWKGLLASFYGGIAEELLTRLIVMTTVSWVLWRVAARRSRPVPPWIYWAGIVVAGVAFGLGHLPVAAGVWDLTPIVVGRSLALNMVGAVGFGYLYWRWGIEYAMVAHFMADVVLRSLGL